MLHGQRPLRPTPPDFPPPLLNWSEPQERAHAGAPHRPGRRSDWGP